MSKQKGILGDKNISEEMLNSIHIISVKIDIEKSLIIIVFRKPSGTFFNSNLNAPTPDIIWKEVYGVVMGQIQFIRKEYGQLMPGIIIPDQFIFESDSKNNIGGG